MKGNLLVKNIGQLATLSGPVPRKGKDMDDLQMMEDAAVAVEEGVIVAVGKSSEIEVKYPHLTPLDCGGKTVLPGFVEPHTHIVFAGSREREFEMRIQGKGYVEIAKEGGGILSSVRMCREATLDDILAGSLVRADRLLEFGVTTCEAKSGYGLDTATEIKQLRTVSELDQAHTIDFVPTFLGAHEVPPEYRGKKEEYIELLINEMIPQVAEEGLAEFCDVFCEDHVFSVEESRKILLAAKEKGMTPKVHADEIEPLGGAEMAAEVGAITADHLGAISPEGITKMAEAGTMAVLLPGTCFYLRLNRFAPARKMIEEGVAVALSTDLNPGSSMTENLPLILTLACLYMGLTPREAITGATINGAAAINRAHDRGSVEVGKLGDLVIWDVPSPEYIPYHYGTNLVDQVIKRGEVVVNRRH